MPFEISGLMQDLNATADLTIDVREALQVVSFSSVEVIESTSSHRRDLTYT